MIYITICGHSYELSFNDQVEDNHKIGMSNLRRGTIWLRKNMPADFEHSTLLHEVIHQIACLNSLNLPNEEVTIDVLALGLFQFIRDNPWLAQAITDRTPLKNMACFSD